MFTRTIEAHRTYGKTTRITSSKHQHEAEKAESRANIREVYLLPKNASEDVIGIVSTVYLKSTARIEYGQICPTKEEFYQKCAHFKLSPMMVIAAIQMAKRKHLEEARRLRKIQNMEAINVVLQREDEIPDVYKAFLEELGSKVTVAPPPAPPVQPGPPAPAPNQAPVQNPQANPAAMDIEVDVSLASIPAEDSRFDELDGEDYTERERGALRRALEKYPLGQVVPLDATGQFAEIDSSGEDFLQDFDLLMKGCFSKLVVPFAYGARFVYETLFLHIQIITGGKFLAIGDMTPDIEYLHLLAFMYDHDDRIGIKERLMTTSIRMDGVYQATANLVADDGIYRGSLNQKMKLLAESGLHQNAMKGFLDIGNFWITYLPKLLQLEELMKEKCLQDIERERKVVMLKAALHSATVTSKTEKYGMANKYIMNEVKEKGQICLEYQKLHTSQLAPMMCRMLEVNCEVRAVPDYLADNPHMTSQIRKLADYINEYCKKNSDEDITTFLRIIFYKGIFNALGSVTLLKKIMRKGTLGRLFPPETTAALENVIRTFDQDIMNPVIIKQMQDHVHGKYTRIEGTPTDNEVPQNIDRMIKKYDQDVAEMRENEPSENSSISLPSNGDRNAYIRLYYPIFMLSLVNLNNIPNDRFVLQMPLFFDAPTNKEKTDMVDASKDLYAAIEICAADVLADADPWLERYRFKNPGKSTVNRVPNHVAIMKNYKDYNGTIENFDYIEAFIEAYSNADRASLRREAHETVPYESRFMKAHRAAGAKTRKFANLGDPEPANITAQDQRTAYIVGKSACGIEVQPSMRVKAGLTKEVFQMTTTELTALAKTKIEKKAADLIVRQKKLADPDPGILLTYDTTAFNAIRNAKNTKKGKEILKQIQKQIQKQVADREEARKQSLANVAKNIIDIAVRDTTVSLDRHDARMTQGQGQPGNAQPLTAEETLRRREMTDMINELL